MTGDGEGCVAQADNKRGCDGIFIFSSTGPGRGRWHTSALGRSVGVDGPRWSEGASRWQLPVLFLPWLTGEMDRWNESGEADKRFWPCWKWKMDEQVTRGTQGPRDLSSERAHPCCPAGPVLVGGEDGGASTERYLGTWSLGGPIPQC